MRDVERVEVHPDEPFGANVVRVGDTVLCSAAYPRTAERVAARGLEVRAVEVDELHKAEAGLSCLALILESP